MVFFDKNVSVVALFYNYFSILQLPTHNSMIAYLTHYSSYKTVVLVATPFDLPTQNTMK